LAFAIAKETERFLLASDSGAGVDDAFFSSDVGWLFLALLADLFIGRVRDA
jgi:hypothetical protein